MLVCLNSSYELCEAFGLKPSEGSCSDWLKHIHVDDRERVQADLRRAIDNHQDFESEYRIVRPDGSLCWAHSRGWVIHDRESRPQQMIGLGWEITARKQSELKREEILAQEKAAREAAEADNRAKDEFLALVSHELRAALNPILGWSRVLMSKQTGDEAMERAAAAIERCARMQARFIEDLLDTARIHTGALRLDARPVKLPDIIAAAVDMARPAAESKGVELQAHLAPDSGWINGDPARLQQIVWNLLTNAIKFTPQGGCVELELKRDGEQILLITRDTGQGIAPDFLPYVFCLFRQAPSADSRRGGGLGLGLAIVRELVELHGGTVEAESPGEGQGSTFTIRFPPATKVLAERFAAGKSETGARQLQIKPAKSLKVASSA